MLEIYLVRALFGTLVLTYDIFNKCYASKVEDTCLNNLGSDINRDTSSCSQLDKTGLSVCDGPASMTSSLALVPYDESKVLPHEKPVREFALGGHVFTIKQDWHMLGVAAVVWDSAVVLAEYLIRNRNLIQGKNVLELGAGTGLTGMVAASLGAHVTVTERAEAMKHLKSTIDHNTAGKSWEISAKELDWRTYPSEDVNFPEQDVIIGADIIYIEETFEDLLRTISSLAKTERTHILLSCKIRYDRDLHFLSLLRDNFGVTEVFFDEKRDIKVFSVLRNS